MPTDKKKEKEIPLGDGLADKARKAIKGRQSQLDAWEQEMGITDGKPLPPKSIDSKKKK